MDGQRVPAWKRIGLKLKHASEDTSTTDLAIRANGINQKRKQQQVTGVSDALSGLDETHHQPKKPRVDQQKTPKKLSKEGHDVSSEASKGKLPKRKKSVTFTADTKTDDGESAQTIQFKVPDSPGSTPKKANGNENSEATTASPRKPKREKKPKSQRAAPSTGLPRKATAGLQYLWLFSHQRSAWKFNKNHDTWILKNALSSDSLPPDHNFSLATYLHTLKSEGARQRLIEQSREALKSEDGSVDVDAETQETLLQAIQHSAEGSGEDTEQLSIFHGMNRPRLILLALGASAEAPHNKPQVGSQTQPRVKKNKSRTSRVEIEDSSSSDSDSEDSGSDTSGSSSANDLKQNKVSKSTGVATRNVASLSSSSSSTDSTSESSAESSSDSDTDTTSDSD